MLATSQLAARPGKYAIRLRFRTSIATCLANSFFSSKPLYLTFDQESKCANLATLSLMPPPAAAVTAAFTGGILDRASSVGVDEQRLPVALLHSFHLPSRPHSASQLQNCIPFLHMYYTYSYLQLQRPGHVRASLWWSSFVAPWCLVYTALSSLHIVENFQFE